VADGIHVVLVVNDAAAHWQGYRDRLAAADDAASVSVAAPAGERRDSITTALGAKVRTVSEDANELLATESPQLAVITLPPLDAPPIIDAALEVGAHVLVEKPACVVDTVFEPLAKKAVERERHLMLAFAGSQQPVVRDAARIIRHEEQLGSLYGVTAHYIADQTRVRDIEQLERRTGSSTTWFFKKSQGGGGHLSWLGIHFIDMLHVVTGHDIVEVSAMTNVAGGQPIDVEDSAVLTMRYDDGMLASLTSAYYLDQHDIADDKQSLFKVWGEHGWLEMDPHEGGPLAWYSSRPEYANQPRRTIGYDSDFIDGYGTLMREAIRAAAGPDAPPTDALDGLQSLRVVHAAYRSAASGQAERVPPRGHWTT
jgi:predicted dehydrogenase